MRRVCLVFLALTLVAGIAGCSTVGELAGNVADAAVKELEQQVKDVMEQNKVEVVQMKTAFGKLNDEGGSLQLFCAVLLKAEKDTAVKNCEKALSAVFEEAGTVVQTAQKLENTHLVHKEITFDHSDFSDGTYYVVYGYSGSVTGKLPDIDI